MQDFLKNLGIFIKKLDTWLLILSIIASAFGILLISSATKSFNSSTFVTVQSVAALLGIVLYVVISLVDLDSVCGAWKILYILNVILIGSLLIFGTGGESTGNRAWIRFGPIGIQPGEFGKILFILTLSGHIYQMREGLPSLKCIGMLILHAAIPIGMVILISKDLGTALVYLFIFLVMLFFTGLKARWFLGAGALVGAATPLLWPLLNNYQQMRILVVFNPELDPLGKGYQAIQSKIALGSGGLFGRGLYNGTQTQYGYLPAKHTDFIFAAAGEELGMVGCIAICILIIMIIIHCIRIARRSMGTSAAYVCIGVSAMLIFQFVENVGMCLGMLPVIGITLPFFSYGGSSVLTIFMAMGLISCAKMRSAPLWISQ
ncbi:MAG: rod shape-determining protein RodA [Clostridia bacterium]|nr:rod shape-determining protein RodA [Clostridia bacterium]